LDLLLTMKPVGLPGGLKHLPWVVGQAKNQPSADNVIEGSKGQFAQGYWPARSAQKASEVIC
jgi:hypothetical protein